MTSYTLQVQPQTQYTIEYSNQRGPQGATGAAGAATTDASLLVSGTLAVAVGGTGLNTLGAALQVLRVNAGGTALEYGTVSGGGAWGSITGTLSSQTDLQAALDAKASTSAVAAGYQPLDSDLTAIAALTTTSTGRALLTESVAQTGTGALVRAAGPTLTGTTSVATLTASGTVTASGTGTHTFGTTNTVTMTAGALKTIAGTKSAPAIQLGYSASNTGLYGSAAGTNPGLGLTIGGTSYFVTQDSSNGVCIHVGWGYCWGSSQADSTVDTALRRSAAGVVEINNGTLGTLRDLSLRNLTASGTLRVGGGTVVASILSATATLDFGSIGSNDTETLTITVTGAVAGDSVFLGCPAGLDAGLIFCASVTAADTVTVRMHNSSGGSIDPASGTFRATVIRF